ncbi:MAG: Dihydrofolate reductase [Amnibacterium sp.]|nr:Dihydrofolate reductase [Amnibacterium sp.]
MSRLGPSAIVRIVLIYSMSVSVDGFIADRDGGFGWTGPSDELFQHQLEQVAALGAYLLGRRLYETMRVWDTEPALRATESGAEFAEIWSALPKIVFSRTLTAVEGNARLATAPLAEEAAAAAATRGQVVSIGGATLAAEAIRLDLVDELRMVRDPVLVGGGTPYFPAVDRVLPLELLEARTFGSGAVYERYRRIR